jgi:hypothetical protein
MASSKVHRLVELLAGRKAVKLVELMVVRKAQQRVEMTVVVRVDLKGVKLVGSKVEKLEILKAVQLAEMTETMMAEM